MYLEGGLTTSIPQGEGRRKKNKIETPKQTEIQPETEFALRRTYQVDFSNLGFKQKHDFNAYNFFIEKEPIKIRDTVIHFNEEDSYVYGAGDSKMTILEFLLSIGIGLQQGAFKIQEYVMSSPEQRTALEESEDLPN